MNKIINIAFAWPKDITKAWSGTAYQIVKQFEKNYKVNLIDLTLNNFEKKIYKFLYKIKLIGVSSHLLLKWNNKKIKKQKKTGPIIQFTSQYCDKDDSYIYVDCTYRYLLYLIENNPEAYSYSNFNYTKNELKSLAKKQDKYFETCSGIFVMSHFLKDFFSKFYDENINKKVIYVGGGVNIDKDKILNKNKENAFLFVGKEYFRKGCDLVIRAFNIVNKKIPDSKLYIIGVDNKENIKNDNIVFLGIKDYEFVQTYFNKIKVFVMPSRFEAYGLVFAEALISGNIIIGNDDFEMCNFINDDNGYKVSLDINDIADKMETALKNDRLLSKIIDDRHKYLEYYSWENVYQRIETYMENK